MWLYTISWAVANGMGETWKEEDWRINDVGSREGHVDVPLHNPEQEHNHALRTYAQ